jgi:hypothetical protein
MVKGKISILDKPKGKFTIEEIREIVIEGSRISSSK